MIKLNKWIVPALTIVSLLGLVGCQSKSADPPAAEVNENKVSVVTTLFPEYDYTKVLAGENVQVRMLMPPGSEAHSYEPTPKDLVDVQNADVFIYTSEAMEPWVEKLLDQVGPNTVVIEAAKDVKHFTAEEMGLPDHDHDHEGEAGVASETGAASETGTAGETTSTTSEEDHDHEGTDPHVWMDPSNAAVMAKTIAEGLIKAMPEHKAEIEGNLASYTTQLNDLDQKIQTSLAPLEHREIVFAGHFALGYLAKKYDIHVHSPYEGFSPDTEPSAQKIAEMVDFMKAENQKVVYYEELIDPKIARIISSETGAEMVMLHAAHNLSKDELEQGLTYLQIMEQNLEKLKKGFGI